jgi:hydroxymethylpyrimidine/phosphomethylpyrimidine kinase
MQDNEIRYKCLSIAGFDGSGGAGIQADLKTFSALGCYGMTVLTALPVQNTCGVRNCYDIPLSAIEEQLEAIFEDIIPDSIKIGMLFSSPIVELVTNFLTKNVINIPIILDPVMVAKSGNYLLLPDAIETIKTKLIPISAIITPNIPEAEALLNIAITNYSDMENAAIKLLELGCAAVLVKGGHIEGSLSLDILVSAKETKWYESTRIKTKNTHGTGCTLSAAITACLAQGFNLEDSVYKAKYYLTKALEAGASENIGHGFGPVHHFYHLWPSLDRI